MPTLNQINHQLDRLAALEPGRAPILSLYLDLRSDEHGRDRVEQFLRQELPDRIATFPAEGQERHSLQRDSTRVFDYLATQVDPAMNGLALFACDAMGVFEAIPLAAPVGDHRLVIAEQAFLYPLARTLDEYPRYLALVADTNTARIFVFALNAAERREQLESTKTRRHKMGGWSQARYQRNVDEFRQQHARDVVDMVSRIVREEQIDKVLLAGDAVIVPMLRAEMSKELLSRVQDVHAIDIKSSQREVLDATMARIQEEDARTDRERVEALIGAFRAGGLGVVGEQRTRYALELGQVHELVIRADADAQFSANDLVARARRTDAGIRFIQDTALLEAVGGVGAFLRFRV
jgi:peptide subunit release factor 1 (eRF1)